MLYLGIDLHGKQMTVSARDEQGEVALRRQVSTRPEKVAEFFEEVRHKGDDGHFAVLVEVCGFHDWLVRRLASEPGCRSCIVIQPQSRSKKKTDRRDAQQLSEVLWVNRQRLLSGQKVKGVRTVYTPTEEEQEDRQLTAFRERLGRRRTQTINQIRHILRRNNREWEQPTKGFQTKKVRQWLEGLALGEVERWELSQLLAQWELWDRQIAEAEARIAKRFATRPKLQVLTTIRGVSSYMGLAIGSRLGDLGRFPRARSLANFLGLTPGSNNSGPTQRLGSITKEGSRMVRFLLGQLVLHVLKRDGRMRAWYKRIKQRRGSKIARVAVMRRLAGILWQMLTRQEAYRYGGPAESARPRRDEAAAACRTDAEQAVREALAEMSARKADRPAKGRATGSSSLVRDGEKAADAGRGL